MIIKIKETNFIIDDDDFILVSKYKWYIHKTKSRNYIRGYTGNRKTAKMIYLHRLILNHSGELDIDHINGDTLDNRKANLRVCSRSQNNANKKMKGYYFYNGKFVVEIIKDKKRIRKRFDNENDAIVYRKAKHIELYGDYSIHNRT